MHKLLIALPLLTLPLIGCGQLDKQGVHKEAYAAAEKYRQSYGGQNRFNSRVSVRIEDLNGDRKPDAIAQFEQDPKLCNAQGCHMLVLENQGNRLKLISVTKNVFERVGTVKHKKGWISLMVSSKQLDGKQANGRLIPTTYQLDFNNGYPTEVTQGIRKN